MPVNRASQVVARDGLDLLRMRRGTRCQMISGEQELSELPCSRVVVPQAGQARFGMEPRSSLCTICVTLQIPRVVANTHLVKRHGSPVFTAAISHIVAWALLLTAATVEPWLKSVLSNLLLQTK